MLASLNPLTLIHPRNWQAAGITLIASSVMFLLLLGGYSHFAEGLDRSLQLPLVFELGLVTMVLSSLFLGQAQKAYGCEDFRSYRDWLLLTGLAGSVTLAAFITGCNHLQNGPQAGGTWMLFLFLICQLYVLHYLLGIILLVSTLADASRHTSYLEGYINLKLNPVRANRFRLLVLYWNTMALFWLYLLAVLF